MKNKKLYFAISIAISIILLISIFVTFSLFSKEVLEFSQSVESGEFCEANAGKWIPEFKECEQISKEKCEYSGGIFQECASSCRNNPDKDAMCITVCVPVCKY